MIVAPFAFEDLALIALQPMQANLAGWVSEADGRALEQSESYTAWIGVQPIGCAGILPHWPGRAVAWAYLSAIPPHQFILFHRAVLRFLGNCGVRRLETTVDCRFSAGHRWARMLGFECEAERMRAYGVDGGDHAMYARVV